MTDRELLEAAAKAAGIDLSGYTWGDHGTAAGFWRYAGDATHFWNPLTDDGDALRLAVKLRLRVEPTHNYGVAFGGSVCSVMFSEPVNDDPYAATRRAVVRAAAASLGERGKT